MKHRFQVSLAVTLAASLQAFVPSPLAAQPPNPNVATDPLNLAYRFKPIITPAIQIESINAATRQVTVRGYKLDANKQSVLADPITLPLAANASLVHVEYAIPANQLKVSDKVTLLGRKLPEAPPDVTPTNANGKLPLPTLKLMKLLGLSGPDRSTSKADEFEIVAVSPLTLRRGGVPAHTNGSRSFLRTPFSDGGEGNVGLLSLDLGVDGAQTVVTLMLTKTEELEFVRLRPIELGDIASLWAAHKITIRAEFSSLADGKSEITSLRVWDIK